MSLAKENVELSSLRITDEHSLARQGDQSHELSLPRRVENPLDRVAGQSSGTHPDLPLVKRLTVFAFPQDIGLLTKGANRHFQKILKGNIPVLALGDYAMARVQPHSGVIRGVFDQNRKRVKVNMKTKRLEFMSEDEQKEFVAGKELEIPGSLLIRGQQNDPHDWDPLFFHDELQKNPHFIGDVPLNEPNSPKRPLHLNRKTSQGPPYSPAQPHDLNPNFTHNKQRNPHHTHDWDLNLIPNSPGSSSTSMI